MKKLFIFLLSTIPLVTSLWAQPQWTLTVEPVYMSAFNDLRAGDIYTFYVTKLHAPPDKSNPGEYTLRYGATYDPVTLTMPYNTTLIWDIQHKPYDEKWGIGMRGWRLENADDKASTIYQPDAQHNEDGSTSEFTRGFRMLNYTFLPTGDLPIDWWAKNRLGLWTKEIYAFKTFSHFNARFGIKLTEISNTLDIAQRYWTSETTNKIYGMQSNVDYFILGPQISLDIHTNRLAVFIQQSVLFGTATHAGNWRAEYYKMEYGEEVIDLSQKQYAAYNTPFTATSQEIIPATELNIKLNIWEKQLNNNRSIQFGASWFSSAFWHTPIAPMFNIGDRHTWDKKRQDLVIAGGTLSTTIRF